MTIDFSAPENAEAYSGRRAQPDWAAAITSLADPSGKVIADIGCGGATYSIAFAELGAARIAGIDASAAIAASARRATAHVDAISITEGQAEATGLAAAAFDIVFSRAVIHHLPDLSAALREAVRILRPGGRLIVQDRTLDDVRAAASQEHIRGLFFLSQPQLMQIEAARRPASARIEAALRRAGLGQITTQTLWEVRAIHGDPAALAADLGVRKGRSLLHALDDASLARLVQDVTAALPVGEQVTERDRWTLWSAVKPR